MTKLYHELADWWPLLSPTTDYVDEGRELVELIDQAEARPTKTLLEFGSGGGSLAHQIQDRYCLTLTDQSAAMLEVSRALNPDCEHVVGDMRQIDLGRQFDSVLIHDAVMYLTSPEDLRETFNRAKAHLKPNGLLVVMPDVVKEDFQPGTDHGGHDAPDGRGLRFLEWRHDRDPTDDVYEVSYALMLRDADGTVHSELDRHEYGLFRREAWLQAFAASGFEAQCQLATGRTVFTARRVNPGA